MKNIILTVFIIGLLAPTGLYAQKVYKEGNRVILDLTVKAGMPVGAITSAAKVWTGSPSNTAGPMDNNTESGTINETVYHKLEIAQSDYSTGTDWVTAFNGCKGWTHNGSTGWRLPTQRELMLMYIFKPALDNLIGTAIASSRFWSSTESTDANSWYVIFTNGLTNNIDKGSSYRVRCVREVH